MRVMIDDLVRQGLIKRHVIDEKAVSDAFFAFNQGPEDCQDRSSG